MAAFHTLKINSIKTLTNEASSIGFEIPTSLQNLFQYRSGQYINLKASIKGEEVSKTQSVNQSKNQGYYRWKPIRNRNYFSF
jgi:ring-1,2-phenylacetyl-CoA epoxidase subunit PaaE